MQYIVKNNLYNPTFTIENCDGSPTDLSHSTVKFILKTDRSDIDSTAILAKEYVNPDTNILQFEFTAEETKNLTVGKAWGAIKIYRDENKNTEIWNDEYTITGGVFYD